MDFRELYGEQITGESYVLRNLFRIVDVKREGDRRPKGKMIDSDVKNPTKMTKNAIAKILSKAMYEQGLEAVKRRSNTF